MKTQFTKTALWLCFILSPVLLTAQADEGLDHQINEMVQPIATQVSNIVFFAIPIKVGGMEQAVGVPIVLLLLILGALYFTLYFGFPNLRYFSLAINILRGKIDNTISDEPAQDPDAPKKNIGEVSAFQALTTAISATVGLGNIAGIAIAIGSGGPGATFWMILAGFLGMSSKFTECILGVKFREFDEDGHVYGGPLYYLRKGFALKKLPILGKGFAFFYAIVIVFAAMAAGSMFQVNQARSQVVPIITNLLQIESNATGFIFGVLMAILVGIVIIGGIKRIGNVAEKIVPLMVSVYVLAAIVILVFNFSSIPAAFSLILQEAFNPQAIQGGVLGVITVGLTRAAFSNEAGLGSASFAHSAVKTNYAASEGIVALLEPFIDTVVVCTMTAVVIIVTQVDCTDGAGIACTSAAFESVIPNFSIVLGIAALLFAFSTMLAWSYYGLQAWKYLFGRNKVADIIYKLLFCSSIVIGAAITLTAVKTLADAMMLALVFPNMLGLILLAPLVKKEVQRYLKVIKSGKLSKGQRSS